MMTRPLAIVVAALVAVHAFAETTPPADLPTAVKQQTATREALQRKADEAQAALRVWYKEALKALQRDAKASGEAAVVAAADAERDRVDRELTDAEKEALPKLARALRGQYDQARQQRAKQLETDTGALLRRYASVLETLEKQLTQEGKLEDAIATRLERTKVAGLLAGGEAPAPSRLSAVPAATPRPAPVMPTVTAVDRKNAAKIEVEGLIPVPLAMGDEADGASWGFVSEELKGATIYQSKPLNGYAAKGLAVYKTLAPGRVFVALNYQYQGNNGGGWAEERWMEKDFASNGWVRVEGQKLSAHKRDFIIMTKVLAAGETGTLRCNKYEPPYLITF